MADLEPIDGRAFGLAMERGAAGKAVAGAVASGIGGAVFFGVGGLILGVRRPMKVAALGGAFGAVLGAAREYAGAVVEANDLLADQAALVHPLDVSLVAG